VSKKPRVDHEYHAGKDKLKIIIRGYTPGKETRRAIIKKVMQELERSPDRQIALAKESRKKREEKSHNPQKRSNLAEVGD
jgi:hypothetical protein